MADEKVIIELEAKVAGAIKDLRLLTKEFDRLQRKVATTNATQLASAGATNKLSNSVQRARKSFDSFDKGVKMMGVGLGKFLSLAIKGTILQMGLLGASLLSVHALFVAGKFLHKAYSAGMQVIAGAAAGAAVAIGTVAAAVREQQAAMFAFKGKGAPQFGSGLNQVRVAMRAMQADASIAGLGVEALNKAFGSMSKSMNSSQIAASRGLLRNLMDFGAAGQDPTQAAEKVGAIIAALNDSKKSMSDVKAAAKELGPEMENALKKAGNVTKKELKALILSGELATMGGVAGQFDAVNQTLIGQVKTFFNLVRGQFADFGQEFLEPAKNAMQRIFKIIQRDLSRVSASLQDFGAGKFMDGLVTVVDKISNFFVKMIRDWLPKADGMFGRVAGWWERTARWFRVARENLRPFIDGARVIEDAFRPIFDSISESFVGGVKDFNNEVQKNAEEIYQFGERISELIDSASKLAANIRSAFFDALPFINDVLSGIRQVFDLVAGTLSRMTSMFGGAAGLMGFAIMARQMRGTQGGYLPGSSVNAMNVNANVVNIGGVGGPGTIPGRTNTPSGFSSAKTVGPGAYPPPSAPLSRKTINSFPTTGYGAIPTSVFNQQATSRQTFLGKLLSRGPGSPRNWGSGLFTREAQDISMDPTKSRMTGLGRQGRLGGMMEAARLRRASAGGSAILGNAAKGIGGINNSMGAKMGVGMGLSMVSQFAPAEMQGALALGGMVGQFNPLAGLAVGLGGAALNAQGGMAGAITGAGAGAAIGTMIAPGIGTAVGAALGAVGGAIFGFANKAKKQAKEARKSMEAAFDSILPIEMAKRFSELSKNIDTVQRGGSVAGRRGVFAGTARATAGRFQTLSDSMQRQGIDAQTLTDAAMGGPGALEAEARLTAFVDDLYANQEAYGMSISESEYKKMKKNRKAAIDQAGKEIQKIGAYTAIADQEEKRLKMLEKASGKSTAELEVLAHSLGVNLYDPMVKMEDLVKQLGLTTTKTAQQIKEANADIFIGAGQTAFQKRIDQIESVAIYDEIGEAIYSSITGGGATEKDLLGQFEQFSNALLNFYGGDAVKALFGSREQLGTAAAPGALFQPGAAFAGIDPKDIPQSVWDAIAEQEQITLRGLTGEAATNLSNIATKGGFTLDQSKLQDMMMGLTPENQERLLTDIQNNRVNFQSVSGLGQALQSYDPTLAGYSSSELERVIRGRFDTESLKEDGMDAVATQMEDASKEFKDAVKQFTDVMKASFSSTQAPEWWNTAPSWWDGGDTSSPRGSSIGDTTSSRLGQTMARHASIDSVLSGSRKITSSYRNYSLGSPSSDHLNGRAIDLVGQNLGRYATLTRQSGGFAEFHGRGGSRHLHAVPGPGAIGDTAMPVANRPVVPSRMASAPASDGGRNYNFYINGANHSVDQIANTVMEKIKMAERSVIQRS